MRNITKKQIWAAILTAAAVFSLTGCSLGKDSDNEPKEKAMGIVETTQEYTSSTDYLYIKNEDGTIAISGYTGSDSIVTVPDTIDNLKVTAVGDHSFEANWDIEEVILPDGIKYIGESAFMDCGSLKSVNIPAGTETIRRAAFASCSSLDNVSVPESVTKIMEETFSGCGSLKNLTIAGTSVAYESWGLDSNIMPELVITCPDNSEISKWANENGFTAAAY